MYFESWDEYREQLKTVDADLTIRERSVLAKNGRDFTYSKEDMKAMIALFRERSPADNVHTVVIESDVS